MGFSTKTPDRRGLRNLSQLICQPQPAVAGKATVFGFADFPEESKPCVQATFYAPCFSQMFWVMSQYFGPTSLSGVKMKIKSTSLPLQ